MESDPCRDWTPILDVTAGSTKVSTKFLGGNFKREAITMLAQDRERLSIHRFQSYSKPIAAWREVLQKSNERKDRLTPKTKSEHSLSAATFWIRSFCLNGLSSLRASLDMFFKPNPYTWKNISNLNADMHINLSGSPRQRSKNMVEKEVLTRCEL